ncbi:glycosyltransferase [Microbacterium paludicola]|uniref:D-inositol 3-phosphate glycosyltransferase n=1 Tax=Microbacterium paludicola TaxID=300019 RepID=A0A4Y9FWS0_9MICO|nr:GDSL-type esterase/lipase family protein [Microbacterium paludicola]MBF0815826.1 glycosyltransferase [Microbacterium paludicola]TFU33470.1 glycosyltransferase [Microbacterium paludicola]
MRVALVAESFLPHMNGVTHSVLQMVRHLERRGHETLVVAPDAGGKGEHAPTGLTQLLPSMPMPSYPDVRVAYPTTARIARVLREFHPDVVHLASPFALGWKGQVAADALRLPSVAVYQTDIIAYTERYGVPGAVPLASAHVARLHKRATLTLAPSSASEAQLAGLGVDRLRRWGRGVDAERFRPDRRSDGWRAKVARGELLVGYVGRLAAEKQVEDLRVLCGIPGVRLVIIGDGPERERLEKKLPGAVFTGFLGGDQLAKALASLDVFVHPGESETFCQTVQEALASGVPVVATGRGGPVDLVRSSVDGWLYAPGDLDDLRERVLDLKGDDAKRRSFGAAARESVTSRTWESLGDQLIEYYCEAQRLRPLDDATRGRGAVRADTVAPPQRKQWTRYVALGDSLTEGLCDTSRMANGEYRGWADRLATLLAQGRGRFQYANLAVRSRRVRDLVNEQAPRALEMEPDLVSIFMGANDLVSHGADPVRLAAHVEKAVRDLRAIGADVLLVTPFLPDRPAARIFARRFALYAAELRRVAAATDSYLLDAAALPSLGDRTMYADDIVHLSSRGHRYLAYRAAEALGIPDAEAVGQLDDALHGFDPSEDAPPQGDWLRTHALPWVWRRMRGRTAGDGMVSKHADYIVIPGRNAPKRSKLS